jgi:hypothetical protein
MMALEGIFIIRNTIMAHLDLVDTNVDRHNMRDKFDDWVFFLHNRLVEQLFL